MSTICYKDGIIAGDTMMSFNSELCNGVKKVGRLDDYLFGFVGHLAIMHRMYAWIDLIPDDVAPQDFYLHLEDMPDMGELSGTVMLVGKDRRIWSIGSDGSSLRLTGEYEAIGSGSTYALGALHAGKSAEESVKTAMHYDAYTGGNVETFTFSDGLHNPGLY